MTQKTNTEGIEFDGTDGYVEQVLTGGFNIPNSITVDIPHHYLKDFIFPKN